jgi:hypothetical protein
MNIFNAPPRLSMNAPKRRVAMDFSGARPRQTLALMYKY